MQLKLANVFRRYQEERRGYETDRNRTNLHTLSNCNISSGSKYHLGRFKMSPLPLSCFCLIPVPLAAGRVVKDLIAHPGKCKDFPFSPTVQTNIMIFLITTGFKGVPFYFLPVPTQVAVVHGKKTNKKTNKTKKPQ